MAYNVTQLISDIKTRAKDSSLSDSLITSFLQETQDSILGHYRLPFMETATTYTLAIDDLTKSYPEDWQVTLEIRLKDADANVYRPEYKAYNEFNNLFPKPEEGIAAAPEAWTDFAQTLYWSCPLDKAYTLSFKYLRRPTQFTSGSVVPDIPYEYKEYMMRGTLGRVEEWRENHDIAALHYRRAEDVGEDMLQRYGARQLIVPHKATLNGKQMGTVARGVRNEVFN